jgi:peptide-methionine (R)-S-oxide reductase
MLKTNPKYRAAQPFGRAGHPQCEARRLFRSGHLAAGAAGPVRRTPSACEDRPLPAFRPTGRPHRDQLLLMNPPEKRHAIPDQKSDADWKALLAQSKGAEPLAFEVTRHEATERAFSGKYADSTGPTAATTASAAMPSCLTPIPSSTPTAAGPVFRLPCPVPSPRSPTAAMAWCGSKPSAASVAPTWAMCLTTAPPTGLRYCMNSASLNFSPS